MGRKLTLGESLGRDWPWSIFDRAGHELGRGKTVKAAIRRLERSEGRYGHREWRLIRNRNTDARWERRNGSWFPIEDARPRGRASGEAEGASPTDPKERPDA